MLYKSLLIKHIPTTSCRNYIHEQNNLKKKLIQTEILRVTTPTLFEHIHIRRENKMSNI